MLGGMPMIWPRRRCFVERPLLALLWPRPMSMAASAFNIRGGYAIDRHRGPPSMAEGIVAVEYDSLAGMAALCSRCVCRGLASTPLEAHHF